MVNKIKYYLSCLIIAVTVTGVWASENVAQNTDTENPVRQKAQPELSNGVNKARDVVLEYFSPLSGVIVDVHDDLVKVKLNIEKGIRKGIRLSVFRQGTPFYHPVTNEPIGRTEDFIGRIEVKDEKAHEGLYHGKLIQGDIRADDILRITSSKIKIAFFQNRKSDWAISEAFYSSLKNTGRFEILESYTPTYEPEELSKLARELGAEAVLMFSTPMKDEKRFLNVRLYWAEDSNMFGEIEEVISHETAEMFTPDDAFISAALTDMEPWGSYGLAGGRLIAIGDVDNNGIREFVISDGNNIRIYNLKEELQELWLIKGRSVNKHLSIDILDLNKNGMAEIFVTSIIDNSKINTDDNIKNPKSSKINSFVIEYDPSEGYRKIKDNLPYFLRVTGKTLLMQKSVQHKTFSGPVYEGEWRDGDYQTKEPLNLPSDVNIYGFTFIDWQKKGRTHLMTFDDKGYLNLYDDRGHLIWKSSKSYGEFELSFERETYSMVNPTVKWFIRGRLISVQTERGQEIIVVNKLPILSKVPGLGVKGAKVYSLWWDGSMMDERLILSEVSGTITDYWIEGKKLFLVARGDLLTFVKNAVTGEFSKGSMLYYYNFTPLE